MRVREEAKGRALVREDSGGETWGMRLSRTWLPRQGPEINELLITSGQD